MKKMKAVIYKILEMLFGGAIYDATIGAIIGLCLKSTSVPGIIAVLLAIVEKVKNIKIPIGYWICTIIVALVITILIIRKINMRKSFRSYYYPKKQIRPTYIIEKIVLNYTVTRRKELNYSNVITIRALNDAFDRFTKKFLWTGLSPANIPKLSDCENINNVYPAPNARNSSPWSLFQVVINPINKNQIHQCTLRWPTIKHCTMGKTSYLSYSTDEPTKEIVFNIDLGQAYAARRIKVGEYQSMGSLNPLIGQTYEDYLDANGRKTITIKAKRFRYYLVDWDWIRAPTCTCSKCKAPIENTEHKYCPRCGNKLR